MGNIKASPLYLFAVQSHHAYTVLSVVANGSDGRVYIVLSRKLQKVPYLASLVNPTSDFLDRMEARVVDIELAGRVYRGIGYPVSEKYASDSNLLDLYVSLFKAALGHILRADIRVLRPGDVKAVFAPEDTSSDGDEL